MRAASSSETVRGMQGPDPEVPLLQLGHELGPEAGDSAMVARQQPRHDRQGQTAVVQDPVERS